MLSTMSYAELHCPGLLTIPTILSGSGGVALVDGLNAKMMPPMTPQLISNTKNKMTCQTAELPLQELFLGAAIFPVVSL